MIIRKLAYKQNDSWSEPLPIGMEAINIVIEPLFLPNRQGTLTEYTNLQKILTAFAEMFTNAEVEI